jgi:hypothetical protein
MRPSVLRSKGSGTPDSHIPQHQIDCPSMRLTRPGHSPDTVCFPAVRDGVFPQITSSAPICFSHFFDSWETTHERRGRLVKTAFFAPRSGRGEAQKSAISKTLATRKSIRKAENELSRSGLDYAGVPGKREGAASAFSRQRPEDFYSIPGPCIQSFAWSA